MRWKLRAGPLKQGLAKMAPTARKKFMLDWAQLIDDYALDLAVLGARDNGTEISMAMLVCLISHSSPFNDKSRFKPDRLNVHIAHELRMHKYSSLYSAMRVDRDLFLRCTPHFPCRNEPHSVRKRLFFCPTLLQGSNYKTSGGTACQSPH